MHKAITEPSCNTNFRVKLPALMIWFSSLLLSTVGQFASTSEAKAAELGVAGTYEIDDITYASMPLSDRRFFFGADPDIEFTLTQEGDKISGEFSGDRDGKIIKGIIDDDELNVEFYLESLGGEIKDGTATWKVGEDGTLKGDFKIRDPQKGVIRGFWTLEKID
jgi:hypothetical protein